MRLEEQLPQDELRGYLTQGAALAEEAAVGLALEGSD
jgi:hypothetical protein